MVPIIADITTPNTTPPITAARVDGAVPLAHSTRPNGTPVPSANFRYRRISRPGGDHRHESSAVFVIGPRDGGGSVHNPGIYWRSRGRWLAGALRGASTKGGG